MCQDMKEIDYRFISVFTAKLVLLIYLAYAMP